MSLGNWNAVRGCPGWYYGLRIRHKDGSVTFDVTDGTRTIEGLTASACRTNALARKIGDKRRGYQTVAREAIRSLT